MSAHIQATKRPCDQHRYSWYDLIMCAQRKIFLQNKYKRVFTHVQHMSNTCPTLCLQWDCTRYVGSGTAPVCTTIKHDLYIQLILLKHDLKFEHNTVARSSQ